MLWCNVLYFGSMCVLRTRNCDAPTLHFIHGIAWLILLRERNDAHGLCSACEPSDQRLHVPSMQVYLYINEISSPSPARTRPRVWIAEPGNLPTNQQCPGYVLHSHVYDVTMAFTLHLTVHIALTVTDVWVQQFAVNNRTLVNRMIAVLLWRVVVGLFTEAGD